jgi:hypothetical protein
MTTISIDRSKIVGTSQIRPTPYSVQRFMKQDTDDGQRAIIGKLLGESKPTQVIVTHWSGSNWQGIDFAPDTMNGTRVWTTTNTGRRSLDQALVRDLDFFRASNPDHSTAKVMLVMQNHPQAMMPSGWAVQADTGSRNWPLAGQWGSGGAGRLAKEIWDRYPGRILGFSYGQEMKSVASSFRNGMFPGGGATGVSSLTLDNFRDHIDGYNVFAKYARTNMPGAELWAFHYNFFARDTTSAAAIDALLNGGGSLAPNDETLFNAFLDRVGRDPDTGTFNPALLPDKITYDASIAGPGRWQNDWTNISKRVMLEFHLARVLKQKMINKWGFALPLVGVESYFDWDQSSVTLTPEQQDALSTAILIGATLAGTTYHDRWECQGGDRSDSNAHIKQSFASWWTPIDPSTGNKVPSPNIYRFGSWQQASMLANMFQPGTDLFATTTDDANVLALSGVNGLYVLNLGSSTSRISISLADGSTMSPIDVPPLQVSVAALPDAPVTPPPPPPPPDPCVDIEAERDALRVQIGTLQADVASLQQQVSTLNAYISKTQIDLGNITAERDTLTIQLNATIVERDLLKGQLSTVQNQLSSAQAEVARLNAIIAATPPQPSWKFACKENASFSLPAGEWTVRYGANGRYNTRIMSGQFVANNLTFGDSYKGVTKHADYAAVIKYP